MERKYRMTKQRKKILQKTLETPLMLSFRGSTSHYHFADGTEIDQEIVKRLFKLDLLRGLGDGLFDFSQSYIVKDGVL